MSRIEAQDVVARKQLLKDLKRVSPNTHSIFFRKKALDTLLGIFAVQNKAGHVSEVQREATLFNWVVNEGQPIAYMVGVSPTESELRLAYTLSAGTIYIAAENHDKDPVNIMEAL